MAKKTEDYELLTKAVSEVSQLRRLRMSTVANCKNDYMIPTQVQNLTGLF